MLVVVGGGDVLFGAVVEWVRVVVCVVLVDYGECVVPMGSIVVVVVVGGGEWGRVDAVVVVVGVVGVGASFWWEIVVGVGRVLVGNVELVAMVGCGVAFVLVVVVGLFRVLVIGDGLLLLFVVAG